MNQVVLGFDQVQIDLMSWVASSLNINSIENMAVYDENGTSESANETFVIFYRTRFIVNSNKSDNVSSKM